MQITLNQDEIEAALRKYVNEQVNIRDGHEITIDLKAGRGENGFSATIDIVPAGAVKSIPVPTPNLPKPSPGPAFVNLAVTKPVQVGPAPVDSVAAQETPQEAVSKPATETVADAPAVQTPANDTPVVAAETTPATQPAPVEDKPKSLFAGLAKPRNPAE